MAKIYYVGDWAVTIGPIFAETPFNYAVKGTARTAASVTKWCVELNASRGRLTPTSLARFWRASLSVGRSVQTGCVDSTDLRSAVL